MPTPKELEIAKILCDAEGAYNWKYIVDIEGNPSTSYAYDNYIKMAQAVIKKLKLK